MPTAGGNRAVRAGPSGRGRDVAFAEHDGVVYLAVDGSGTRGRARFRRHPAPRSERTDPNYR